MAARGGLAHAGVSDDRRQVHILQEHGPVDDVGVEAELFSLLRREQVVQRQQAVDLEDGFRLRIGAVELDVCERPFGFLAALFDPGRQICLLAAQGQGLQRLFRPAEYLGGLPELVLYSPPPGKDHSGATIGWPLSSARGWAENQS